MNTEYSIYVIRRLDKADRDAYIGCTNNMRARKAVHKHKAKRANEGDVRLYDAIRAGGGWQFYEMVLLDRFDAESPLAARQRERMFFDLYKPSLNSQRPHVSREECRESQKLISAAHYQKNKPAYLARSRAQSAAKRTTRTTTTISISFD